MDPSGGHNLLIRKASENGHWQVVQLLLQVEGVDPTDLSDAAIRGAINNGQWKVVSILADYYTKKNIQLPAGLMQNIMQNIFI